MQQNRELMKQSSLIILLFATPTLLLTLFFAGQNTHAILSGQNILGRSQYMSTQICCKFHLAHWQNIVPKKIEIWGVISNHIFVLTKISPLPHPKLARAWHFVKYGYVFLQFSIMAMADQRETLNFHCDHLIGLGLK